MMTDRLIVSFLLLGWVIALEAADVGPQRVVPLPRAHAHNDYEHSRPLWDALDQGFGSVEADIYLVDGQLLVAHDLPKVRPERTLQRLYLDPLRDRVRQKGGRVHGSADGFTLLIDLKSAGDPTYRALSGVLAGYREMLTVFHGDRVETNAVTVIVSGDRPRTLLESESTRYAGLDGRLVDLGTGVSPRLMPLISDRWGTRFTWLGEGELPTTERALLQQLVRTAHQEQKRIRFWGAPDGPAAWAALDEAGVDLINTDRLAELSHFLRDRLSSMP
jgi:hypothetical protein